MTAESASHIESIITKHFIEQQIEQDIASNKYHRQIHTRFPPEPNGYLHIGHAKSICLNFAMAAKYKGSCNLRFDDTNPVKEEAEYIEAIKQDLTWLGFKWDNLCHTSEYFEQLYNFAIELINNNLAYVCSLTAEETREYRGTLTEPGKNSPYRDRTIEENLELFKQMYLGKFQEGEHVLRAKIDMSSGNINLRDPIIYRILHATHPHIGDKWCIYPTYDFAHSLSDAIEGITHSLCTLEFQDHRPLYDWFVNKLFSKPHPRQIEFAKLNISHTMLSKRNLKKLVDNGIVNGWDDPRMPTLSGLRRRGYTPNAIKNFCEQMGISKSDSLIDLGLLEEAARDDLNICASRIMCVVDPLKVTITNFDTDKVKTLSAINHPQNESMGTRDILMSNTLYIEREDFMEQAPNKKFKRLTLGGEVRLRYGYIIKCNEVIKDSNGNIIELKCSYDHDTLGKNPVDRKVKGVIHWVCAKNAQSCEVRNYDRLFDNEVINQTTDFTELLGLVNKQSLSILKNCYIEANLPNREAEAAYQFERLGYYVIDRYDSSLDCLIFNRVVSLRDSWAKVKNG